MDDGEMRFSNGEVVYLRTFLLPEGETVEFAFSPTHPNPNIIATYNKFTIHAKLRLEKTDNDGVQVDWSGEGKQQVMNIRLRTTGTFSIGPATLNKPLKVAEVGGKPLGFYSAIQSTPANVTLITIQFVYGGNYE